MDEIEISKKELLELTGISYGQLYRWKRKNLIPEEWFNKKASFTGQETFFPKEKILKRIESIVNMKDEHSLDDIADHVAVIPKDISVAKDEIIQKGIISQAAIEIFRARRGEYPVYTFEQILIMYIADQKLKSGDISSDEAGIIIDSLAENYPKLEGRNGELIFCRKLGVSFCLLVGLASKTFTDMQTKVIFRQNLENVIEELKIK